MKIFCIWNSPRNGESEKAISTRLFKNIKDSDKERRISVKLYSSCCFISNFGRTPTIDEYKVAIRDIELTKFVHHYI